jgi:hypothetical protein
MDGWMDVHGSDNQASTCNVIQKPQDALEVTTKIAQFNPGFFATTVAADNT